MTAQPDLRDLELLAVELAQLAGDRIVASLGQTLAVKYKKLGKEEEAEFRDPVSEIDSAVEAVLRERLAEHYPTHAVIGEEEGGSAPTAEYTWVIDPVDGTSNFVNGFPIFAASIGILHHTNPVVGAVWCSTSHALRPGVYHASEGGTLYFDGSRIEAVERTHVKRRIVGMPNLMTDMSLGYEARQTGSAAAECAFVAAGLLAAARFDSPNIWDVAGGVPLVRATGGSILTQSEGVPEWQTYENFDTGSDRLWRQPMIVGSAEAATALALTV
ncbi:inositol monophosphatase family protein [Aureimonas fodinaquatilis]|uniref:Inositol monophosphatase family protein n=1 Tax=Aureimonas fodinaquatilis TaxID=2565783 RepID=A0A5B0DT66_9HYPH|nr:inositol monophosphatase family protein [Aureimonas fodinaquatilis]KAA0968951.1 inositol monophosphatase family protein [Aureimonas fodinaquatilis]